MSETQQPKAPKEHKHDWRWTPKGPDNFNVKLRGQQRWYVCVKPGCGSMTLRQAIKRKSKGRKK